VTTLDGRTRYNVNCLFIKEIYSHMFITLHRPYGWHMDEHVYFDFDFICCLQLQMHVTCLKQLINF
jgi:hypothetical protein